MEDIDSDDDDSFGRDEDDVNKMSLTMVSSHVPAVSYQSHPSGDVGTRCRKLPGTTPGVSGMPSKEELLIMMDKVDRDIMAVETQISALQKKQVNALTI